MGPKKERRGAGEIVVEDVLRADGMVCSIRLWIDGQEAYEWNSSDKIAWNGTTEWTLTEAQVERLNREADRLDTDVAWWHFVGE